MRALFCSTLKRGRGISTIRQQDGAQPRNSYDVVVVGAGHNGLVAAGYLARAGKRVCVLERRHVVGGAAVTEEIVPGFKFSRASYVLSLLRPQIYKDLELKKHGLKVYLRNPSSYTPLRQCYWREGGPRSLTLGPDEAENKRQIGQFSQKDAEAYAKYEEQLGRVVEAIDPLLDLSPADVMEFLAAPTLWRKFKVAWNKPQLRQAAKSISSLGSEFVNLYEFMTAPGARILERYFESEPLKATLATDAVIGANITPHTPGSGYVLLHHVMGEVEGVRGAWGYPEGGMGAVTQAMAASASTHSAHIFTNTVVSKILVDERNQVGGVLTEEGMEIKARIVLSNTTPQCTLRLIPGTINHDENLGGVDYTSPVTKINVALDKLPNFLATPNESEGSVMPHHCTTIHLNCENMAMISEAHEAASRGEMSTRPVIEMVIPSSLDPTLCPPGSHVCLLFTQYAPKGCAWSQQDKEKYANTVFNSIEDYAPGFKNSIVGHEILSPPDLEEVFGLTGGNIFHGAMSADRLFLCRPSPESPTSPFTSVSGLLLCGAGAHPGGGVMGAPGRIAAQAAIKQLGSR